MASLASAFMRFVVKARWEIFKDIIFFALKKKTRAWWHQVHEYGLHTLQTSAWDVCSAASSVKSQM
jgi:hypothetical protein